MRTIQGRFLLRPSDELNDLVVGVLGRAQEKYAMLIHAFVAMGNHVHLLCSPRHAAHLAAFMAFVASNIAREAGRLHDWRERFWRRRYVAIVVADVTAQVARLKYILRNGCKEGLVASPGLWPGASCVRALAHDEPVRGTWFDRTAEYQARRRGETVHGRQFASEVRVRLAPLPCWREVSPEQRRTLCRHMIAEVEQEARAQAEAKRRGFMGVAKILAQDPHSRPAQSDRSPAPPVHASTRAARNGFLAGYRAFVDAFRAAAAALRRGVRDVEFPLHAFPPALPFTHPPPTPA